MTDRNSKLLASHARRKFLLDLAKTATVVGLSGVGIAMYSRQASSMPAMAVRPPGALPEEDFMARCIRCGLCVRDCPYDILSLATLDQDVPLGTPFFTARTNSCKMCPDIPCVPACPTGALDHDLTDINKAKMGLAVLIDQEECIAFQGLRCEVCFNVCPIQDLAISLEYKHNERSGKHALLIPIVHSKGCTGCGMCEEACILDEAAIKVFPMHLAKGELGKHYRLGWDQKSDNGKSLINPDPEHQFNLPEGAHYDFNKGGLRFDKSDDKVESSGDKALSRLKMGIQEAK